MTKDEALELAGRRLAQLQRDSPIALALRDDLARDLGFGWSVPYTSEAFLASHDLRDALVGTGPIFVAGNDRSTHLLPSARFREWLATYETTGAPPPPEPKRSD